MNSFRKKRSESTSESSQRAQRLNKAADRFLEQQISDFDREEKQLEKELRTLRRTREALNAGFRFVQPQAKSRSLSDPPSPGIKVSQLRCKSGFSIHGGEKLPQIVTNSPTLSRKSTPFPSEDLFQCCKTPTGEQDCHQCNQAKDASLKGNEAFFLLVREKVPLRRALSSGNLSSKASDKECNNTGLMGTVQGRLLSRQDLNPRDEENKKETSSPVKVKESNNKGARTVKSRSQSDGSLVFDNVGSLLSSLSPAPPTSPRPRAKRSNSLFTPQSSRTNAELMATAQLSGKFKSVGRCALGVAVINRMNGKLPDVIDVEQEDELDARYNETVRRSHVETDGRYLQSLERRETVRNIVLPVPSTPNNKSPMISRKAQVCWNKEERKENSPQKERSKIIE